MPDAIITADGISKSYKNGRGNSRTTALDGISFEVSEGEIFGLIGPDGAGKTTAMRIITSLMLPDAGRAAVCGLDSVKDYAQIRNIVGYMPGRFSLYQDLSVEENLQFFATIFGVKVKDNYGLIKEIYDTIAPFKDRRAGKLSGGMKQKLALCCALVHKPRVLILDEPTTGVDPVSRQEFWDSLGRLKTQGITVLASTPYMDEASRCDRISFLVKGKIPATDAPRNIVKGFSKQIVHARANRMFELLKVLREYPEAESAYAFGDNNHVTLKNGGIEELKQFLASNGYPDAELEYAEASLEDCFMNLPK